MRVQLLPSTFDSQGHATLEQRLTCFLIDESVAVDAGSIALALTAEQRETVRDIIVTHPHMDHIASLPIFIDDLFETLESPVRVHATPEVIDLLERDKGVLPEVRHVPVPCRHCNAQPGGGPAEKRGHHRVRRGHQPETGHRGR